MTTSAAPLPIPPAATPAPAAKPAKAATPAPKPAAKAPAKAAAKPKTAATKAPAAKAAKPKKPAKPVTAEGAKDSKAKKPKLVRDSFTIPKDEYAVIETLKQRSATLAQPVKKSELLRAGIKVLAALSDSALRTALQAVPSIKTGRPKAEDAPAAAKKPTAKTASKPVAKTAKTARK